MASKATKVRIDRYSDTEVIAQWSWNREHTDHYEVQWRWATEQDNKLGTWQRSTTTSDLRNSVFSIPDGAVRVSVIVKPIAETHEVETSKNGHTTTTQVAYWTAEWSSNWWSGEPDAVFYPDETPAAVTAPPVPTVKIDRYYLTAEITGISADVGADGVEFQIDEITSNYHKVYRYEYAQIIAGKASCQIPVELGKQYVARAQFVREWLNEQGVWSDWSDYQKTGPSSPERITICRANSETSAYLEWTSVGNADSYEIEYATKQEYFDGSDQTSTVSGIEGAHYEKTGLESGERYYFRVRAVNDVGESEWSPIASVVLGTEPAAPTTWSSTTTVVVGEPLLLYWIHNSEDGSHQTKAELELTVNGATNTITIQNGSSSDDDEEEKINQYTINTSDYGEGAKIQWRVRTAGITNVFGNWSIQRTIDIYAPPTLSLDLIDASGEHIDVLSAFPLYVAATAGPVSQKPIGYHVTVTSNQMYETTDEVGNRKIINAGTELYSKYFDITTDLMVELSANTINLENNGTYTVTVQVTMNSGLTADSSISFSVGWSDEEYYLNAEIGIDRDTLSAYIRPYIEASEAVDSVLRDSAGDPILDNNGDPILGTLAQVFLSVYRKDFDGGFTEIASGLDSRKATFVTDPHPALDYARYRIVAKSGLTGALSFYDVPSYPVQEPGIVIQWDEEWSNFDVVPAAAARHAWSGSMLKLPYNVDVSNSHSPDVALVEYVGRKNPVSYFGTQLGETSVWNAEFDKADRETQYALRRLSVWMGNVYVRESSGIGYWATVTVSNPEKHLALTIPVTLNVTRVEGGM